jgi:hypothetical protein
VIFLGFRDKVSHTPEIIPIMAKAQNVPARVNAPTISEMKN